MEALKHRALHPARYYKLRHRVTGLYLAHDNERMPWSGTGRLFKSRKALNAFLCAFHPHIPREWEVVPLEIVIRDDRTVNARVYAEVTQIKKHTGIKFRAAVAKNVEPPPAGVLADPRPLASSLKRGGGRR